MDRPTDEQVAQWYPRLFRTALRMTGSIEDAADLTQQAFCKAFESWGRFDGKSLPTTWLHAILLNCVRDWARRRAGRRDDPPDPWETAVVDKGQNGAEELAKKETVDHLRQEIGQLPDELRRTFVAVVIDGYTYQEAAALLSIPVGTVGSRMNDARRRLRLAMRHRFPEA